MKLLRDMKLSTKFIGAIAVVLLVMTAMDIAFNAEKSRKITHDTVKEWTFLFAENVRVSLNMLMRNGEMDARFSLFKSMQEELSGLKDVRVIRSQLTNDLFLRFNKTKLIPPLQEAKDAFEKEISELKSNLETITDEDEKEEIQEQIEDLAENIAGLDGEIKAASALMPIDPREKPIDELDNAVLAAGKSIYYFEGDNARVLIPYTAKEKGCSEQDGCHVYAKPGDVLGAISLEFSLEVINEQISKNNVEMAGVWFLRFIVFLLVIVFLLSFIVTKNLYKMLDVFDKVSKGDFSVRSEIKSKDEMGLLGEGFNKMASSLEETRKQLDKRLLEIYALYNVSKTLNTSFETEQLLNCLIEDISKNMDIDRMMVLLPNKEFTELIVASYTGFTKDEIKYLKPSLHEGVYSLVATEGISRIIENVDEDATIIEKDILRPEIGSLIAVPFLRRGQVLGLICAFRDRPKRFSFSDLKLFNSVAEHLAVAIENARLFEKTKEMAITDGLTHLYNKRYMLDALEAEVNRAARYRHELSFLIMDIDNFKHYNDSNGHPAGDSLLKELALIIQTSIRETDIACRYGGEEFVVIFPETEKTDAKMVAEKLVKKIAEYPFDFAANQPLGCISVSMGLATYPHDAADPEALICAGDKALYVAKESGKNRVVLS